MNEQIRQHLIDIDEILKDLICKMPILPNLMSTKHIFHDLMSCIIEQQIHYRSTKKIFQKILDLSDIELLTPENFSKLEARGLQKVKLSTKKYETILGILDFFKQHDIDWSTQTDEEVRALLSQIKGVGPWTIDMLLMYTLERPNIFPADDYHLKQVMTKLYPIDTSARIKAQQKAIAEYWVPYRSFGVRYLLAWKSAQKSGIL